MEQAARVLLCCQHGFGNGHGEQLGPSRPGSPLQSHLSRDFTELKIEQS